MTSFLAYQRWYRFADVFVSSYSKLTAHISSHSYFHTYGKHTLFLGCLTEQIFGCTSAPQIMMVTLTQKGTQINICTLTTMLHITYLGVEGPPCGSHTADCPSELLLRDDLGKRFGILCCKRRKATSLLGPSLTRKFGYARHPFAQMSLDIFGRVSYKISALNLHHSYTPIGIIA